MKTINLNNMIRIGNYLYEEAPTGEWLKVGRFVNGIDSEHIIWFA